MLQSGGSLYGCPIARIEITLIDGRKITADLPGNFTAPDSEEQSRRSRIMDYMRQFEPGQKVKGQTIAFEIEEEYDTIRKTLSSLVADEFLFAKQGVSGYSHGPKFASFKA